MSEASFETVLSQLRAKAPRAPERLREQVRSLPAAHRRTTPRLRHALAASFVIAIAIAVTAAVVRRLNSGFRAPNEHRELGPQVRHGEAYAPRVPGATGAPSLTAKSRLQKQDVAMRLRVDDLSDATQSAVRTTHRLVGFVAGAD